MSAPFAASPELQRIVARQRRERPGLEHVPLPRLMPQASPAGDGPKPIRCKQRYIQWHGRAYRTAMELKRRFEDRAEEIDAALEKELEEGPDFLKWHRGSMFKDPPRNNIDRNHLARIWFVAQMIERKSWICRNSKKRKRGGTLGTVAIELLRTMLFVIKKHNGQLYPSYETLAILSRKSRRAIVTAMKVLERMGFVTIHKRIKRIQTAIGPRVVQESNCYQFHLPKKGLGALAMSVFCPPSSECTKSTATKTGHTTGSSTDGAKPDEHVRGGTASGQPMKEDRWWLHEPLATGSGGWR
jgi:hypothetical protein